MKKELTGNIIKYHSHGVAVLRKKLTEIIKNSKDYTRQVLIGNLSHKVKDKYFGNEKYVSLVWECLFDHFASILQEMQLFKVIFLSNTENTNYPSVRA